MSDDFAFEPVRGLPEQLPQGEHMLWQGAPDWQNLARRALHVRKVAVWFAILLVWSLAQSFNDGRTMAAGFIAALWVVGLGLLALSILHAIAFAISRTSVYTITTRRVVMRCGVALPITINLPFSLVASAALKTDAHGFGDIPMVLSKGNRVAYFALWPHARPWHVNHPQPMFRSVRDAAEVAQILADALTAAPVPVPRRNGVTEVGPQTSLAVGMVGGQAS